MANWNQAAGLIFLAGAALKSTIVLGAAWLATGLMRRSSAAARHIVWTAAFAAILLMPALSWLPPINLPGVSGVSQLLPSALDPVFRVLVTTGGDDAAARPATSEPTVASGTASAASLPIFGYWRNTVVILWGVGVLAFLLQMTLACLRMARERRAASMFREAEGWCEIPGRVKVLEAPAGSMPMTFGFLRPSIFMPADAPQWDGGRRRMVMLHELAHIRRFDNATQLLARSALSFVWWHPLAWKAWNEFLKERECATDDLVLNGGARATDYAASLLEMARSLHSESAAGIAAVAMARPAQLEGRLMAILDGHANRQTAGRASVLLAAGVALVVLLPLTGVQAQGPAASLPADVDATIRVSVAQRNHDILDTAAQAYQDLKQYDTARKLLNAALEIRGLANGQTSAAYAEGLVKLGNLELAARNIDGADAIYRKAIALGDRPEVVPALVYLGLKAYATRDAEAATGYFLRAANVASTRNESARAQTFLAMADQLDAARAAQAESRLQAAISNADAGSAQQATSLELYARFLEQQSRAAEAQPVRERAIAVRKSALARMPTRDVAASTAPTEVMHVGNGVTPPMKMSGREPEYSEEARMAKLSGRVLAYVEVGVDGKAHNIKILQSLGLGLDEKAIEALHTWTFRPGTKNGKPVNVSAQVEVNFRLL